MKHLFLTQDHESKAWAIRCFLLGLGIIFWLVTSPGCATQNIPKMDVSFWAGDSAKAGISRAQEGKTITCTDPTFDTYACLTYHDLQTIYSTILQCDNWGPALATPVQLKKMANQNKEVIENVIKRSDQSSMAIQH